MKADYNVFDYLSKLTLGGNWAPVSGKTTNNSIPYPHAYDDSGNLIGMGSSNPTDKVVINRSKCFWFPRYDAAERAYCFARVDAPGELTVALFREGAKDPEGRREGESGHPSPSDAAPCLPPPGVIRRRIYILYM